MNPSAHANDESRILDFLSRVDRRLRLGEAFQGLTYGLFGLALLLVFSKLAGMWDRPGARGALLLIYGIAAAAFVAWSFVRRKGLRVPAGIADERSDAKDALKSALDFLGLPVRTPFMELQIHRTAELASGLSTREMVPAVIPRPLFYSSGLVLLLATVLSWNPPWLREVDATAWLASLGEERAESLAELPDEGALPEEEPERLEELDAALEELRRRELEMPEALGDLKEAQEALAASRVSMEQLEMDLENMGAELESAPALADLAEALKSHDAERAAELLRALAERLSEAQTSEELKALLESLQDANLQQVDLSDLMEKLEKAQGNSSEQSLQQMAQALEQAASQLESMGEQMGAQQPLDSKGQEMQSLEAGLGQQQAAGQQQMGQQQQSGGQAMQSASGMTASQLQMAQLQGDPSAAVPVDAGPAGDSTGPGGGEQPVMGEATSLDVQLQMEVLETAEREEPVPEEVFERLSREEKSTLNYEAISQRGSYAEESALRHESVPWPYRSLVKRYFLSIVSKAEAKSESGSEK